MPLRLALLVAGCGLLLALRRSDGRVLLVALVGALVAIIVRKVVRLSRLRGQRFDQQRAVLALCDALSAELRAGLPALTAVERSCAPSPELAPVVAAARLGGDIAGALRHCGERPGAEGLRAVAAAWDVAGSSGAALAAVLERVAASLRSDDEARAEVQAALGPPRATAKMLAVLPAFGIALGSSMDANPLRFLVGTSWGLGCLSVGVVLALSGVWWVEGLATAAEI